MNTLILLVALTCPQWIEVNVDDAVWLVDKNDIKRARIFPATIVNAAQHRGHLALICTDSDACEWHVIDEQSYERIKQAKNCKEGE